MTAYDRDLMSQLAGRTLPGGEVQVAGYESAIADHALRSSPDSSRAVHPIWLLFLAMRGMGITVDELCEMAGKTDNDTLLFGTCHIQQQRVPTADRCYVSEAAITDVGRRKARDGSAIDSVDVTVHISDEDGPLAVVTNTFLFKRGRGR